jgi:hypothetical protein
MARLTRRQKEFLSALLELHGREKQAVHYTSLARHLGVGNATAYEMLRLLEEKGFVAADYQRSSKLRGPGRASVVFFPTPEADLALGEVSLSEKSRREWEGIKQRMLGKLEAVKTAGHELVMEELLSRLPRQRSATAYMAEMATAILVGLHAMREQIEARGLRGILQSIGLPGERGLSALAGLGIGLSMAERFNAHVKESFLEQVQRYQSRLSELSAENRRRLAQFTQEVLEYLSA